LVVVEVFFVCPTYFFVCVWVVFLVWVVFWFFGWELGLGAGFLYVAWECLGTAWAPNFPSQIKVGLFSNAYRIVDCILL